MTTSSTTAGSNLSLANIQNAAGASSRSAVNQGLDTFDQANGAMLAESRAAAASLPALALLPSNPKLAVFFPIVGLIAAVAVTQLLRRRRIAQLRSSSSTGL